MLFSVKPQHESAIGMSLEALISSCPCLMQAYASLSPRACAHTSCASFASHRAERAAGLMSICAHVTSQPVIHHEWSVSGLDLLHKNPCDWPTNRSAGLENKYRETSVATDIQVRDGQRSRVHSLLWPENRLIRHCEPTDHPAIQATQQNPQTNLDSLP